MEYNVTDVARTFQSPNPLLNLLIAASILSKITQGKSYLQGQQPSWYPYRPLLNYYPPQLLHPLWYPIDPYALPPRVLPVRRGQLPAPPLNQQQIIHIHETQPLSSDADGFDSQTKFTQSNYPEETTVHYDQTAYDETVNSEQMETASTNDEQTIDADKQSDVNVTLNEIPEPDSLFGSSKPINKNQLPEILTKLLEKMNNTIDEVIVGKPHSLETEFNKTAPNLEILLKMVLNDTNNLPIIINVLLTKLHKDSVHDAHNIAIMYETIKSAVKQNNKLPIIIQLLMNRLDNELASVKPENIYEEITLVTKSSKLDEEFSETKNDLQVAAANVRRQRPYNYDYYDDGVKNRAPKPNTQSRNRQRPSKPVRLNSKRGQYRPLTTNYPEYDDDYDYTTPKNRRRSTTRRYNNRRRSTTSSYEFDEYEEPTRKKNYYRKTTTPAYDDYYNNDDIYEGNNDDDIIFNRQRVTNSQRQRTTTESESSTITSTTTGSTTTTTEPTTTTTQSTTTNASHPYPGHDHNISITYGPPPMQHPGYGPSNGNEHISITYGPPTGSNTGILDSWYNQYAKTSVIKRIQELLTPNNYYSPQYDTDRFNYNDGTF